MYLRGQNNRGNARGRGRGRPTPVEHYRNDLYSSPDFRNPSGSPRRPTEPHRYANHNRYEAGMRHGAAQYTGAYTGVPSMAPQPTAADDLISISNRLFGIDNTIESNANHALPVPASASATDIQSARPVKRMRADNEVPPSIVITYPSPLSAAARQVESSSFDDEKRIELLREAYQCVLRRIQGHSPESDPKDFISPSKKTTDEKLKHYLDFDQGTIAKPSTYVESAEDKEKREGLNRRMWRKAASLYKVDLETAKRKYVRAKGLISINGQMERPNNLFNVGLIWSPIFYYQTTNTVFYGDLTTEVIQFITSPHNAAFETPENRCAAYRMASRGYPRTAYEVERLANLARNQASANSDRIGAHTLLRAFYLATRRIDAKLHDEAMQHILNEEVYHPLYFPSCIKHVDDAPGFSPMPPTRISRVGNRHDGLGLPMPTDLFDPIEWSRYYLIHHTASTLNAINGITMDYGGRVRLETVFANRLARALSPLYQHARNVFIAKFAYLAARPHLYAEYIETHNVDHPESPFIPANGPPFTFTPIALTDSESKNFNTDDLCAYLIRIGVSIELLDHSYAYGRQYLDHTYYNFGKTDETRDIDNERMERLKRFGVPPTISDWSGWFVPSYDDIRRLKYFYHTTPRDYDLKDPYWITYEGNYLPVILISRLDRLESFDPPAWDSHRQFSKVNDIDINMSAAGELARTTASEKDKSIFTRSPISPGNVADDKATESAASAPIAGNEDDDMDAEGEQELENSAEEAVAAAM